MNTSVTPMSLESLEVHIQTVDICWTLHGSKADRTDSKTTGPTGGDTPAAMGAGSSPQVGATARGYIITDGS